ncbi:hypothetical protein GBAR_LOCUS22032 [Geodia barretti]|uniref:Uncharacterized protein n=1 Tax=Geodia barretti TaxID=519541 RepID=A0AA35WZE1_GEOBA|nr:hypothetical protein GBAR_LOCUS22032 [Geodia barretti]
MLNCSNSYSLLTRIWRQELQSRTEAKDRELAEVQQQLRQREEQSGRDRREMRREIEAEFRMTIRREEEEEREPVLQRLRNAISLDDIKEKLSFIKDFISACLCLCCEMRCYTEGQKKWRLIFIALNILYLMIGATLIGIGSWLVTRGFDYTLATTILACSTFSLGSSPCCYLS